MFNVVNKCEYRDGVFTTRFTKEMKPHIYNLKKDYTRMSLDVLCSFKSLFTTRVYEILRTQYYRFDREQCDQLIVPRPPKNPYTIAELKYPLISKPLDKYGSRGIFIIKDQEQLAGSVRKTAEFTDLDEILIEEYNDGFEFNMMTWVSDGAVRVISIADREKTQFAEGELPESTRNVYPSCLIDKVEEPAVSLLQSYIEYTGQKEGPLSMQFFWKPGRGIQVCEIAGRFFGYEHELTEMVYGFQTEELLLDYLYEKDRIKEMFHRHDIHHPVKYGAVLYFQGRQLQIADQTAACELAKEKCVVKPWIFYKEGERVIEYGPNPYLALYYIETENRRQLELETEKFFSEMSIRDPEGREVAYRNKIPEYEKEKKTDD